MKGLSQFESFNWDGFATGKTFVVTGTSEYRDYTTKTHLGTKVDCVIADDQTIYEFKNGNSFTNRFEKISCKVGKYVSIPTDARVIPKGVKARIYGDYRNQLSVYCDDITVMTASSTTHGATKKELV